jgi:hypothetical protein
MLTSCEHIMRGVAELDEATRRSVAEKVGGVFVDTDVADREQVENAVQTAISEYGRSTSWSTTRGTAAPSAVSRTIPTSDWPRE